MSIYKRSATHVTELSALKGAIDYIFNPEKTCENLIFGMGIGKKTVYEDMRFLKELYCKTTGRQYLHWILSHDKDVALETVEAVNREVIKLIGSEFQVAAAIHTNKENLHSHFIINSVRITDGKKFSQSRKDMLKFRQNVNIILESYGLKTIGKENDFRWSCDVTDEVKDSVQLVYQPDIIWTQRIKPFVLGFNISEKQLEEKTGIQPFDIAQEPRKCIKPFVVREESKDLIKPFQIGRESKKRVKPFVIGGESKRLTKPFVMEGGTKELVKPFTIPEEELTDDKPSNSSKDDEESDISETIN